MLKKKGDGEHCELKAAQGLLESLGPLNGKLITSDALHNQSKTAQITVENDGHYLQQVKDNQETLNKLIEQAFEGVKPKYGPAEKGHGRIERRAVAVLPTNAMQSGFPYARSILVGWTLRTVKGETTEMVRHFISDLDPKERTLRQWEELIRGHWGGVENRNHWRKDAVWLEDTTRSRKANIVGNLAQLRNALLRIYADHREQYGSLPAFSESLQADPAAAFALITRPLHR